MPSWTKSVLVQESLAWMELVNYAWMEVESV